MRLLFQLSCIATFLTPIKGSVMEDSLFKREVKYWSRDKDWESNWLAKNSDWASKLHDSSPSGQESKQDWSSKKDWKNNWVEENWSGLPKALGSGWKKDLDLSKDWPSGSQLKNNWNGQKLGENEGNNNWPKDHLSQGTPITQWAAPLANEWLKLGNDEKAQLLNNWPLVGMWIAGGWENSKNSNDWTEKNAWLKNWQPKNW